MTTTAQTFTDARRVLLESLQVLESVGSLDSAWPARNEALRVARKAVEGALQAYVDAASHVGLGAEEEVPEKTATDISVAEIRKALGKDSVTP